MKGLEVIFERNQQQVESIQESVLQAHKSELVQLETYTRKDNIEINGVPETPEGNLMDLSVNLAGALGVILCEVNV